MIAIKLDLRDLTQAHIDEAMPKIGSCTYQAPCIIGTLIPPEQRAEADEASDNWDGHIGSDSVANLISRHILHFPTKQQEELAKELQKPFDLADKRAFASAVKQLNQTLGLNLSVKVSQ